MILTSNALLNYTPGTELNTPRKRNPAPDRCVFLCSQFAGSAAIYLNKPACLSQVFNSRPLLKVNISLNRSERIMTELLSASKSDQMSESISKLSALLRVMNGYLYCGYAVETSDFSNLFLYAFDELDTLQTIFSEMENS
jgi:hypothetical protein